MPSPTQQSTRPFISNFLAAFRAHSSLSTNTPAKQSTSPPTSPSQLPASLQSSSSTTSTSSSSSSSSSSTTATTQPSPSHPRTISPPKSHPTTSALAALHSPPLSRSPGTSPGYMSNMSGGRRRGSDSEGESGGGFREMGGGEKWYVGGRTAGGDERFFRLGVVRRDRSLDRLSADRMSL